MNLFIDATPVHERMKGIGVVLDGLVRESAPDSLVAGATILADATQVKWLNSRWPHRNLSPVSFRSSLVWESLILPQRLAGSGRGTLLTLRDRTLTQSSTAQILWLFEVPDHRVQIMLSARQPILRRAVLMHSLRRFRQVTQRVEHFIVSSEFTARDLETMYGVPRSKITKIYPGISPSFVGSAAHAGSAVPRADSFDILHVATGDLRENTPTVFAAVSALDPAILARVRLVIAGVPQEYRVTIDQLARRHNLQDKTDVHGYIPPSQMLSLFTRASVYFDPTLVEGFGLQIVEAMACGIPVVASTTSSVPEVSGGAALLAGPYDVSALSRALELVAGDERARHRLVEAGVKQAGEFSWGKSARQVNAVLEASGF